MKLHFFKKLAAAMAVAVAVTALPAAPANVSQAAAAPAFKTSRKTLYENGDSKGTYTYTVKNIKKGYTVRWSLADTGVDFAELAKISTKASGTTVSNKVTIASGGDMKAKNGKLSIVAKVYDTSGKLVKTLKDNVTLKIQATTVKIKTTKIQDKLTALSVGKAYDFDRTIFPYNSTSKTYWSVTDSDGTDCSSQINSSGVWTPKAEGTYKITAISRNAKTSKELCRDEITAVVGTTMGNVTQTAVNKFTVSFNSDVSKVITTNSFTIKETNGLSTVLPKSVSFSKDGKTVTVTTHTNFRDAASYTVTYGAASKTFIASAGAVTRIDILTSTVPVNTATAIDYALYDSNGIDVTAIAKGSVEFTASITNGYMTEDNKLFLTTVGKGGTITIVYTDGATKLSATKSITCKETEASQITSTDFTITDSAAAPDFKASGYKANTSVSIGETGYAHFRAVDSAGNPVNYTRVTYASSDENTLIVESGGKMTPIKEGTAVVIVSAFEGTVETNYTFPVTIQAKKKITSLGLSAATVTMSNCGDSNYKKYIDVIPYDQFGKKMPLTNCTVTVSETYNRSFAFYNGSTGQIELSVPAGTQAGTYTLTVTAVCEGATLNQKFYLVVVNVPYDSTAIGYTLELSTGSNTVDVSMKNGDSAEGKVIYVRLGKMQGGVFAGYSYFDSATIRKDNLYYTQDLTIPGSTAQVDLGSGVDIPITLAKISSDGTTIQKAAPGTYSIVVKLNNRQYTLGFTITDNQDAPVVSVKSTTSSRTVSNALELASDCLNIPAGYELINCTAVGATATGAAIPVSSGSKLHILTVTLRNQIKLKTAAGTEQMVYVTHTVNVGQTLTNK